MSVQIRKASRQKAWLKVAITGITGSGKTYGALQLARGMSKNPILIDTENGSGELYSNLIPGGYDYIRILPPYTPAKYVEAIEAAVANGNDVIIIDSLSHAWKYVLDYKDGLDAANPKAGFANWRKAKKLFDETMTALLQSPIHVIACMREKSEYTESFDQRGSKHLAKTGTTPIAEPDLEFEFTTCWQVNRTHQAVATKDRTEIWDVATPFTISPRTGEQLMAWMNGGAGELIRHPNWVAGMSNDEETRAYLQEAAKLQIGTQKQPSVNDYRDVITLWKMDETDWAQFKTLTIPQGKTYGTVLYEAFKAGLRDLQDASQWVKAGCPPMEEPEPGRKPANFEDSEPIAEPSRIGALIGLATAEVKPSVETKADPAAQKEPAPQLFGGAVVEPKTEAYGYAITQPPIAKQFEKPITETQHKMLQPLFEQRQIKDAELQGSIMKMFATAFAVPQGTAGWAAMLIEFLKNANDDAIDLIIADAENPEANIG